MKNTRTWACWCLLIGIALSIYHKVFSKYGFWWGALVAGSTMIVGNIIVWWDYKATEVKQERRRAGVR